MKKIIVLLMTLCLLMASAMPVLADSQTVTSAVEEFSKLKTSYESGDYEGYTTAYNAILEVTMEFDDNDSEEFETALETAGIDLETYLDELIKAAIIMFTLECRNAYVNEPGALTAYAFTSAYSEMETSYVSGEELEAKFVTAAANLQADYTAALGDMPTENVNKLIEEYGYFELYLLIGLYDDDFADTYNSFKTEMEKYPDFTEEEKEQLIALLECEDLEEVESLLSSALNQGNVIIQIVEPYEGYFFDQTPETAEAFVEAYEAIFNSDTSNEEYEEIADLFFPGIHDEYTAAKELISDSELDNGLNGGGEGEGSGDGDGSGDGTNEEDKADLETDDKLEQDKEEYQEEHKEEQKEEEKEDKVEKEEKVEKEDKEEKVEKEEKADEETDKISPQTGYNTVVLAIAIMMLLSAAGIFVTAKKIRQ